MCSKNYIIKCARTEDVDVIFDLDQQYEFDRYSKELIFESICNERNFNYIAYCNDVAVAYISFSCVVDEGEIIKIVVAKDFRNMGIGSFILRYAIDKLQAVGVNALFLEVRSSNIPAKKLYEKNQFVQIHKRLKYYNDGEDADIYRLSLL
jgi:ribosomal-protein-alanine N-acetyltransferase